MTMRTISVLLLAAPAAAQPLFTDSFTSGPSPLWGNERGAWAVSGGAYAATLPSNSPPTLTTLPFVLGDFDLDIDVLDVVDGGIWVHLDAAAQNGLLLVTGGFSQTGNGFYWHVLNNGVYESPVGLTGPQFTPGDDIHLRISARGPTYTLYLGAQHQFVSQITFPQTRTGRLGLYDYHSPGQLFDNVVLTSVCYANCDASTNAPVLNVADFTCFLQRYAAGDSYANCDASTNPPVLNVADFTCFLQGYASGCP
jgi:hypothetical protein